MIFDSDHTAALFEEFFGLRYQTSIKILYLGAKVFSSYSRDGYSFLDSELGTPLGTSFYQNCSFGKCFLCCMLPLEIVSDDDCVSLCAKRKKETNKQTNKQRNENCGLITRTIEMVSWLVFVAGTGRYSMGCNFFKVFVHFSRNKVFLTRCQKG